MLRWEIAAVVAGVAAEVGAGAMVPVAGLIGWVPLSRLARNASAVGVAAAAEGGVVGDAAVANPDPF